MNSETIHDRDWSPLSHRPRIARLGYGAHAHKLRARAWPVRPPSLTSAKRREALGSPCGRLRRPPPCASDSFRLSK